MKKILFTNVFIFLIVSTNYLPICFAQDYTQWNLPEGAKARLGKGSTYEIKYSPDGTKLAVASNIGIWIYDAQTGQELDLWHTGSVYSVAFSPDRNTLATGGYDGTIRLWNAHTGQHIRTLTGHTGSVFSVAFSPDGNTIATGSADGTVLLWELNPTPTSNTAVSLSPVSVASPGVGEQLTFTLNITKGQNVAGYQATVQFDTTILRYVESANGDYLPAGAFFIPHVVEGNTV